MKWVRVEDGLPEFDECVDIWLERQERRYFDCWRQQHKNGDGWIWMRRGYNSEVVVRDQHEVSHWLKIEPPE